MDREDRDDRTARDDEADAQLQALLHGAREHYNVPRHTPSFDHMWTRIEQVAFGDDSARGSGGVIALATTRRAWGRSLRDHGAWVGLAAGLLIGVLAGRQTVRMPAASRVVAVADTAPAEAAPVDLETARYLGQTAALLVSLPGEPRGTVIDEAFATRAQQLLATTRVLLDAADDSETRALLEDLELVLAQIVGIRANNRTEELELINQALEQRELLPRLHSAVNGSSLASAD